MVKRPGIDLDAPLLQLTPTDHWTHRSALTHKLVLGTTGSGKSSSTIAYYFTSTFLAGYGALITTAKFEDFESVRAICQKTGRLPSLINWTPENGAFNPIAYELARTGNINAVIDVVMAMIVIVQTSNPLAGRSGDQFLDGCHADGVALPHPRSLRCNKHGADQRPFGGSSLGAQFACATSRPGVAAHLGLFPLLHAGRAAD